MFEIIKVGDSEKKVVSCLSAKWFYKTLKTARKVLYSKMDSGLHCVYCKLFWSENYGLFVSKPFITFWHL